MIAAVTLMAANCHLCIRMDSGEWHVTFVNGLTTYALCRPLLYVLQHVMMWHTVIFVFCFCEIKNRTCSVCDISCGDVSPAYFL